MEITVTAFLFAERNVEVDHFGVRDSGFEDKFQGEVWNHSPFTLDPKNY